MMRGEEGNEGYHRSAFIYHDAYLKYDLGSAHPLKPHRCKQTLEILQNLHVFDGERVLLVEPSPATDEDLMLVHTSDYINFVKEMSEIGHGFLDFGDTPVTKGIYEGAVARVGGSLEGARLILSGRVSHAFNFGGGWHHARSDRAAGFCVFNDVAIAARFFLKEGMKVAIVDVDGHHGDGTQQEFYDDDDVLTISFHRYGFGFYPGTGDVDEIGNGEGEGYAVNVPLPAGTDDESYLYAFREIVPPLISAFKPDVIIQQFGVDTHYEDPLVGLSLTTHAYENIARIMHHISHDICEGRYLILGGGGYSKNVARSWAIIFITISEARCDRNAYEKLHDPQSSGGAVRSEVKKVVERVRQKVFGYLGEYGRKDTGK